MVMCHTNLIHKFYFHFNNHIIEYYKLKRIFTYQFNDETQLVHFYLRCAF